MQAPVARPAPSPLVGAVEGPTPPASIRVDPRRFRTARPGGWAQAVSHSGQPEPEPEETAVEFSHRPVMVTEVVEALRPTPPGLLVDGTVGGGGHALALLAARPDWSLLGLDRDEEAVAAARQALAPFASRVEVVHSGFEA